jgi:hypothetical protein
MNRNVNNKRMPQKANNQLAPSRRRVRRVRNFMRRRNNQQMFNIPRMRNATARELSNQLNVQRPLALTPINRNTQRSTALGKTILRNREYMGDLTAGMNYYNLKPGFSGCKALDYQSLGFDNYKWHEATLEFRSNVSTATNGRVVMTIDYEGNPPTNVQEIMSSNMSKTTNVYRNANIIAKSSSLMKQKLHAVAKTNDITEITGTPTSCGTVAIWVDGLPTDFQGVVGTLYLYYNIELLNFTGLKNTNSAITTLTSQIISAPYSPALTAPIVTTDDEKIEVVERNALETSTNSLVDGFQINSKPEVGTSFTVATTPLASTGTTAVPSIRIRNSDGAILPANYYKLESNTNSLINNQNLTTRSFKDFHSSQLTEVDASVIDLFFTTVTFVKDVADFVSSTAKIILEFVKPFATTSVSTNAAAPDLVDQISVVSEGTTLELQLPDTPSQPLVDNLNLACVIYLEEYNGESPINARISRDAFNSEATIQPTSVEYSIQGTGGFSAFAPIYEDYTEIILPGIDAGEIAFKFNFIDINNEYFKVGNTYSVAAVYATVTGADTLTPPGHMIESDVNPIRSYSIIPFNAVNTNIIQNFTIIPNESESYSILYRIKASIVSALFAPGSKGGFTFIFSDITNSDRINAKPITTSFQNSVVNRFKKMQLKSNF